MTEFLGSLTLTEWLLLGGLVLAYVLIAIGAVAFGPGQVVQDQRSGGRHRAGSLPAQDQPLAPREPSWLGGDESQGWWIWRDND